MAKQDKPSYSEATYTSIPVIDEGHNKLSEIHNRVKLLSKKEACKNDLTEVFFALSYFFEDHLLKEELYLKSKGYPTIEEHKASHADFIKGIENLKDSYANDVECTLKELDVFIGEWLRNHALKYNNDVVAFLNHKK